MAVSKSLLYLSLLTLSAHCSSETLVPFIAWSNSDVLSSLSSKQPATVGDFIGVTDLKNVDLFVVFRTSKLSFDDIAKYGGVYGEKQSAFSILQSQLRSSQSTLWTGMQGRPATTLTSSLTFNYDLDPLDVLNADDISLGGDGKQLIVVLLPDDDNEERALLEQGKVVSEVMSHIASSQKSFVAFYTSDSSSPVGPQIHVFQFKRQAVEETSLDDEANANASTTACALISGNSTRNGGRCAMMCLTTPIYIANVTDSGRVRDVVDTAYDVKFISGACDGASAYFNVQVDFSKGMREIKFSFFGSGSPLDDTSRNVSKGFWTIDVESEGTVYVRNTQGSRVYSKFEVPVGASYACGENAHNVFQLGRNYTNNSIAFSGIQGQLGGTFSETSFASAYNCESYLDYISLMGIFSVLILIVILYCSTVFMFQMKTMDRFDDPRGPTISVENVH